jgi:hypothetical protein
MKFMRDFIALGLTLAVLFLAKPTFAQSGPPDSDFLKEYIRDHNAPAGARDVSLAPPAKKYTIPEVVPEGPQVFDFPGRSIGFLEGTTGGLSDLLTISPYQVSVTSDDEIGLMPRLNAIPIPASALERFLLFSIKASSDGDVPGMSNQFSDFLKIKTGIYSTDSGTVEFDGKIPESSDPAAPEPPLLAAILPRMYDVYEPGKPGVVSDYVDILTTIQVQFISSDNPADYANLPPAQGFITEDAELGGRVFYVLGFVSDTEVPEPSAIFLLGLGSIALVALHRRRK